MIAISHFAGRLYQMTYGVGSNPTMTLDEAAASMLQGMKENNYGGKPEADAKAFVAAALKYAKTMRTS